MARKMAQKVDMAIPLSHQKHLRELDETCGLCKEFITGLIGEETWRQRSGMAKVKLSRWSRFVDALTLSQRCEDVIIPGYGGKGVHSVFPGCGCSSRVHDRGGCTKCSWCTKGYDSPMA